MSMQLAATTILDTPTRIWQEVHCKETFTPPLGRSHALEEVTSPQGDPCFR